MRKKLLAIVALVGALMLVLTGCQAALVDSNVTLNADGSGTKTITAFIAGDSTRQIGKKDLQEGEFEGEGTVGDNSTYLLLFGDELAAQIKTHVKLEDAVVTAVTTGEGNDRETTVTLTYSFTSVADYNAKTKTLAGASADKIVDATFTTNEDGTYTFKDYSDNTFNSINDLMGDIFADTAIYHNGQPDYITNQSSIFTIMSVSATIGETTTTIDINKYNTSETAVEQDYSDDLVVTGTIVEENETKKTGCGSSIAVSSIAILSLASLAFVFKKRA